MVVLVQSADSINNHLLVESVLLASIFVFRQ